ncbi:RNA-binding protein lark [Lingula anatina]|uniref:RNA-binding protein lark n=1 Tax=Lingula anatina TaxID=7574 RepID=A0A1S3HWM9_LINAN|nr:RNA-binding protein lark [Lingula anatina]XP_013390424.1 RNA-binding protein lark [Lingula anatina]|eukprot:XP_013390423.1 RNA-binding protein lark [Lingula anatina]
MTVSTKIFVGNLPDTCKRGELQAMFEKFGTVTECDIIRNYGFVHFADGEEAKTAVENLNNTPFQGVNIKVELSHSKVRQKPGMGGKGECYRCGRDGHWSKDCPRGGSQGRRGGGRGGGDRRFGGPPAREPYGREPYPRDPYPDPYYRDYPPPHGDRYRPYDPYERRRPLPPPPRDYYRDPYARPPPEYYGRRADPYYDAYYDRRPPPPYLTEPDYEYERRPPVRAGIERLRPVERQPDPFQEQYQEPDPLAGASGAVVAGLRSLLASAQNPRVSYGENEMRRGAPGGGAEPIWFEDINLR